MDPLSRLEDMLSEFRPLFKYNTILTQGYSVFQFLIG